MSILGLQAGEGNPEAILGPNPSCRKTFGAIRKSFGIFWCLGELFVTDKALVHIEYATATVWGGAGNLLGALFGGIAGAAVGTSILDDGELKRARSQAARCSRSASRRPMLDTLKKHACFIIPKDEIRQIAPAKAKGFIAVVCASQTLEFGVEETSLACEFLVEWLSEGKDQRAIAEGADQKAMAGALEVIRRCLDGVSYKLYIAPGIPNRKLNNIVEAFGNRLQTDDTVLALYDGTLFGKANNGWILTARGFGYKELGRPPMYFTFKELGPDQISACPEKSSIKIGTTEVGCPLYFPKEFPLKKLEEVLHGLVGLACGHVVS